MAYEFIARKGLIVSGSTRLSGSVNSLNGYTGSLLGTSSFSETASYSSVAQTLLGSVVSASYAGTSSYSHNFRAGSSLTNNHFISGSWTQRSPTTHHVSSNYINYSDFMYFESGFFDGTSSMHFFSNGDMLFEVQTPSRFRYYLGPSLQMYLADWAVAAGPYYNALFYRTGSSGGAYLAPISQSGNNPPNIDLGIGGTNNEKFRDIFSWRVISGSQITASSGFHGNGNGITGIVTSSYAVTASHALNAGSSVNFSTGSYTGSFTGSLLGNASTATTASYSVSSSYLSSGSVNINRVETVFGTALYEVAPVAIITKFHDTGTVNPLAVVNTSLLGLNYSGAIMPYNEDFSTPTVDIGVEGTSLGLSGSATKYRNINVWNEISASVVSASSGFHGNGAGITGVVTSISSSFAITASVLNSSTGSTIITPSISNNSHYTSSLQISQRFIVLSVSSSTYSRLRLYNTDTARNTDLTRVTSSYASASSGLLLDVVLSGSLSVLNLTPPAICYGGTGVVPSENIYYTITNLSGGSTAVSSSLTYVKW